MRSRLTVALGRAARAAARLKGSSGSAFPGLVAEKVDPSFMARTLAQLPYGVVVVSGTNGKTTTTKMLVELLSGQGLRVFTNRTGSNFTRGVVASLLTEVNAAGKLQADVAVLELDEAHAVHFVREVKPRACLLLNVMRDQLDRFGEIDNTAALLHKVASATTELVVVNGDDPRLAADSFTGSLTARVARFGVGTALRNVFVSDDDLRAAPAQRAAGEETAARTKFEGCLEELSGRSAQIRLRGESHATEFAIPGVHNILNATAALTLASELLGERADVPRLLESAAGVRAAFGRGEVIRVGGQEIELALVKNPAGFRMSLLSSAPHGYATMIAINDEYADGRDMSWLWDVEFAPLREGGVDMVSGVRAWDMALRLRYDGVPLKKVEPELDAALKEFIDSAVSTGTPMRIFTTYTAMLAIRAQLSRLTDVEDVFS
ncbi:MurT ligase domain-containing protein [Dermabacteraceae bacterium P9123]